MTREHLEAYGHYPAGLFRTGGALRQAAREPLPPASPEGRPLRLLLALSSSRRELAEAVAMLRALQERHSDIEVGVRPHPEFPLALLQADLREAVGAGMRDLSGTPLADNLEWCDAVAYISSTVALEALLAGRPVITLRPSDVIDPDGAHLSGGNAEGENERAAAPAEPDFWVCSWEELCGGTEGVELSVDGMQPDVQGP